MFGGLQNEKIFIKTEQQNLFFNSAADLLQENHQGIQSFICHNGSSGSYSLKNKIQLPVMMLLEAELSSGFVVAAKIIKHFYGSIKKTCSVQISFAFFWLSAEC